MSFKTTNILGFNFINTTLASFIDQLKQDSLANKTRFIVTANPEIVMYARRNPDYHRIIEQADYLTPDGIGIVKASQKTSSPIPDRITGYDVFLNLLSWADETAQPVYFLGSKPEVIHATITKVKSDFPNLTIAGYHDGYYTNEAEIVQNIADSHPKIIFVATGFPKQEQFIARNLHQTSAIWMGVGGSFDVYSGYVKRAPEFWQQHHLEWFYRLITDPKRLKRQLVIPQFMWLVWRKQK